MQFFLPVAQLHAPVSLVADVVDAKHANVQLQSVKLDIQNGIMRLTGANSDIEIEALVGEVNCETPLSVLVAPKQLQEIIRYVPNDAILHIAFENNKLSLQANKDVYQLSCMEASAFPHMKLVEETNDILSFSIIASRLTTMIQRVVHAVAQQDIRQYLNGVLFECVQSTLRLVATDSHRMAIVTEQLEADVSSEIKRHIVVKRAMDQLGRILARYGDEAVDVTVTSSTLIATMPSWRLSTKLVNVNYPNYEQVIPAVGEQHFTCTNGDLKQAIKKTSVVGEQNRGMQFAVQENDIVCEGHNLDTGEMARTVISAEVAQVSGRSLSFNGKFLADVAGIFDDDMRIVFYCDENQPSVLLCPQDDNSTHFVIMPIKL